MWRVALTDGSGRWFNLETATKFVEDTRWNGNNNISVATGSQWDHETLYRTAGRRWVLHHWSGWQGSLPNWTAVDTETAARWLSANGHDAPEVAAEIAALEYA